MSRAVLIVNPFSSGVTLPLVERVGAALARVTEVTVKQTRARGHATELATEAAADADAVIVFSGDGTYNEAVNGHVGTTPFGFIPGGGSSVFPRGLGLPRDPVGAAIRIAEAIEADRTRMISLGRVNGRRFCFSAGVGFDAEAVRRVDSRGRAADGRRAGNFAFVLTIARQLAERRLRYGPEVTVHGYGRAAFVLVANGRPYTYAGPIPLRMVRDSDYGGGLAFAAPTEVRPLTVPRLLTDMWRGVTNKHPLVLADREVDRLHIVCDRPLPLHSDGEDLGDVVEAMFEAERNALRVFV
ncbi:MAG: diacylglycerol kinase family protein [Actinomycetes bacterium]